MLDGNAALAIHHAARQQRSARHRPTRVFRDVSDYGGKQERATRCRLRHDVGAVAAWALEAHDDPSIAAMTELLASVLPSDVPRMAVPHDEASRVVVSREAIVLAAIDGVSALDEIVDALAMPVAEVLRIVCTLCALGVIALGRPRCEPPHRLNARARQCPKCPISDPSPRM